MNEQTNKLECNKCIAAPAHQHIKKADKNLFEKTGKILLSLLEKKKSKLNEKYQAEIEEI